MAIPATIFTSALPVSTGFLGKKIRNKYDTSIVIRVADGISSTRVTALANQLKNKLPDAYSVIQQSYSYTIRCYCSMDSVDVANDFNFKPAASNISVEINHISKDQVDSISEFGKVLRKTLWEGKYAYRATVKDTAGSMRERSTNLVSAVVALTSNDEEFLQKFEERTEIPVTEIATGIIEYDYDEHASPGFFKVTSSEMLMTRMSANKFYLYSTNPGIGMMASLCRGPTQSVTLEEVVLA